MVRVVPNESFAQRRILFANFFIQGLAVKNVRPSWCRLRIDSRVSIISSARPAPAPPTLPRRKSSAAQVVWPSVEEEDGVLDVPLDKLEPESSCQREQPVALLWRCVWRGSFGPSSHSAPLCRLSGWAAPLCSWRLCPLHLGRRPRQLHHHRRTAQIYKSESFFLPCSQGNFFFFYFVAPDRRFIWMGHLFRSKLWHFSRELYKMCLGLGPKKLGRKEGRRKNCI